MKCLVWIAAIVWCVPAVRGDGVDDLIAQLRKGDNQSRREAARALGEGGAASKAAVPALIAALKDRDTFVRRFSIQALGAIGPDAQAAVRPLTAALSDTKQEVRNAAAVALGKLGPSGVETLIGILGDDNQDAAMRSRAVTSLSELGSAAHSAVPVLTELVKGTTMAGKGKKKKKGGGQELRVDAANALGVLAKSSDSAAIETLSALTDKKAKAPRNLRQAAKTALRKIKNNKKK